MRGAGHLGAARNPRAQMPETPAAASLTILAGPLKGRRLILDDAVDDILIGSDPDCRLCIEMDGVSPIHARLWLDPEGAILYDTHSAGGVYVNDDRVSERAPLRDGDIIWLGAPAAATSVMLQFRHPGARAAADAPAEVPAEEPAEAEPERVEEAELLVSEPDPVAELETEVAAEAAAAAASPAEAQDEWMIEDAAEPAAAAAP